MNSPNYDNLGLHSDKQIYNISFYFLRDLNKTGKMYFLQKQDFPYF